jgi:hypothetical protein
VTQRKSPRGTHHRISTRCLTFSSPTALCIGRVPSQAARWVAEGQAESYRATALGSQRGRGPDRAPPAVARTASYLERATSGRRMIGTGGHGMHISHAGSIGSTCTTSGSRHRSRWRGEDGLGGSPSCHRTLAIGARRRPGRSEHLVLGPRDTIRITLSIECCSTRLVRISRVGKATRKVDRHAGIGPRAALLRVPQRLDGTC